MKLDTLDYDSSFVWNGKEINFNSKSEESIKKVADYTGMKWSQTALGNVVLIPKGFANINGYFRYIGDSEIPDQPIGLDNYDSLFEDWEGQSLDLSSWKMDGVTTMTTLFQGCAKLNNIKISNWNVSNVRYMTGMFSQCESLEYLDISNWNVSNVISMWYMFRDCKCLKELDLSNWEIRRVQTVLDMFHGCNMLEHLLVGNWAKAKILEAIDSNKFLKRLPITKKENGYEIGHVGL